MEGLVKPFWTGRKVVVTGHTGFKGGWLALWLQWLGADVLGFALPPPATSTLFDTASVSHNMQSVLEDIRNLPALQSAISAFSPEIVFHLAAQPLVRASYRDPLETFATNVTGTANLLECLRQTPSVRAAVIVTSDKCYENHEAPRPYRESDPLGGYDPYSASKACAELVTGSYRSAFLQSAGIAVATARAGNVIGGGDWAADRLIPDILRGFSAGQTVRIRHPHALRPWQHVLEPLHGYLLLAERLHRQGESFAGAWNFGPDPSAVQPVQWVTEWLAHAWGAGAAWERDESQHVHEAGILTLDSSKAIAALGWQPKLSLPQALTLTLDWYRQLLAGEDMQAACLEQIRAYHLLSAA